MKTQIIRHCLCLLFLPFLAFPLSAQTSSDSLDYIFNDKTGLADRMAIKFNVTDAINGDMNLSLEGKISRTVAIEGYYGKLFPFYTYELEFGGFQTKDDVKGLIEGGKSYGLRMKYTFKSNTLEGVYSSMGFKHRRYRLKNNLPDAVYNTWGLYYGFQTQILPHFVLDVCTGAEARFRVGNDPQSASIVQDHSWIIPLDIRIGYLF